MKKGIRGFVRRRTNETEKLILKELLKHKEELTANQFVQRTINKLDLAENTIWYNLRKLRKDDLVTFGNEGKIKMGGFGRALFEFKGEERIKNLYELFIRGDRFSSRPRYGRHNNKKRGDQHDC